MASQITNPLEAVRNALAQSYKHRRVDGIACAACGAKDHCVALHVVEYAQPAERPLPDRFVPQSASYGTLRGAFAFCDSCAPACKKCGLPRVTARVKTTFKSLRDTLDSDDTPLHWGVGRCEHAHLFGIWPI